MTEDNLPATEPGDKTSARQVVVPPDLYADEAKVKTVATTSKFVRDLTRQVKADLKKLADLNTRSLNLYCDIGDKLIKLKTELGHGEWLPYLDAHFSLTDRTARLYMEVAGNRKFISDLDSTTGLAAAISKLRAHRKKQRATASADSAGTTFTPEQLEKRTQAQTRNATRRVIEQMGKLASEPVEWNTSAHELWPDPKEGKQRSQGAIDLFLNTAMFLLASGVPLEMLKGALDKLQQATTNEDEAVGAANQAVDGEATDTELLDFEATHHDHVVRARLHEKSDSPVVLFKVHGARPAKRVLDLRLLGDDGTNVPGKRPTKSLRSVLECVTCGVTFKNAVEEAA